VSIYHPSAAVRLQVRLEEREDVELLEATLERRPIGATAADIRAATDPTKEASLDEVEAELLILEGDRQFLSDNEYQQRRNRLLVERNRIVNSGGDLIGEEEGQNPDGLVILGSVQPTRLRIMRNGLRQADTFSATLNFQDAPFDPRAIRSAEIAISLGTVSADEFSRGMGGERRPGQAVSPDPLMSLVPTQEGFGPGTGVSRFVGFVDTWKVSHGEREDIVELTGRDVTSVLIDQPVYDKEGINLSKPIDQAIKDFLNQFKATRDMDVVLEATPVAPPGDSVPTAFKPRGGKVALKRGKAGGKSMSMWDVITEACVATGLAPYMEGFTLRLVSPRNFFAQRESPVTLVYGENIVDFDLSRKFAAIRVPTIEVRSYDVEKGRTLWARATQGGETSSGVFGVKDPPKENKATRVSPSGGATDSIRVITLADVRDPKQLERAALSLFEQIGRQEVEGTFSTREITSLKLPERPEPAVGNLLNLNAGDAIELLVKRRAEEDNATTLQDVQSMVPPQRRAYLMRKGYSPDFAEKISDGIERASLSVLFYVKQVSITYGIESGIDIQGTFINFNVVEREEGRAPRDMDPAPGISAALEGRDDGAAKAAKDASAAARDVNASAQAGDVTPDEFAADGEAADEEARVRYQEANP